MPIATDPRLQAALKILQEENEWTLRQQIALCEIEAPPFQEAARGEAFRRRLEALGLNHTRTDAVGNVIAVRPGASDHPFVVLSAHLDTVFPKGTDVRVRREGARLLAPGIGDNARGLAVVLAVVRAFQRVGIRTQGTLCVVGTVGEEGEGNLRGVRHLCEVELRGQIDSFVSVDAGGLGITSRAVGSRRYRVTYRGPGGHSFGAFGLPNPIHALGRAIARIADLNVPAKPKTTFNVGVVGGGTAVNAIPSLATMDIDLRSEATDSLEALDDQVKTALQAALEDENERWSHPTARLTLLIEDLGVRPAGSQPDSLPIVRIALESAKALSQEPGPTSAGSTDCNIPISLGIPAVAVGGGGRSGRGHSLEEWYEDGDNGYLGPQRVALMVAQMVGLQ